MIAASRPHSRSPDRFASAAARSGDDVTLPKRRTEWLWRGFQFYLRGYLRRHFDWIAYCGEPPRVDPRVPLIVYGNHPSWWDPLVAMYVADRLFSAHTFHAPIQAAMLEKYPIFERLGVFGVDLERPSSGRRFVATSQALLAQPGASLWLTPQGQFCDVRRHAPFRPGLGAIAAKLRHGVILPVAIEYTFWNESRPEVLLRFGAPISAASAPVEGRRAWTKLLEQRLEAEQFVLAQAGASRRRDRFETLLNGGGGVGGVYDAARRTRAWLTGRTFQPRHEEPQA